LGFHLKDFTVFKIYNWSAFLLYWTNTAESYICHIPKLKMLGFFLVQLYNTFLNNIEITTEYIMGDHLSDFCKDWSTLKSFCLCIKCQYVLHSLWHSFLTIESRFSLIIKSHCLSFAPLNADRLVYIYFPACFIYYTWTMSCFLLSIVYS